MPSIIEDGFLRETLSLYITKIAYQLACTIDSVLYTTCKCDINIT